MIPIDKTKAGCRIECQGNCEGATKHVQLLLKAGHNAELLEVCTICEAVLQADRGSNRLVRIGWLQSIHIEFEYMERAEFINL